MEYFKILHTLLKQKFRISNFLVLFDIELIFGAIS